VKAREEPKCSLIHAGKKRGGKSEKIPLDEDPFLSTQKDVADNVLQGKDEKGICRHQDREIRGRKLVGQS